VIRQTDRATRLVSLHGALTRFVRDHLMSLLTRLPSVEQKLDESLSGIAVDYRHSPIVEEHGSGMAGPAAGDRAPDARVANPDGRALRLYDLLAKHRHALLLLSNIETPGVPLPHGLAVHRIADPGAVAAQYGSAPATYLIRPDGYIGFRCAGNELSPHLPRYLARLFGAPS